MIPPLLPAMIVAIFGNGMGLDASPLAILGSPRPLKAAKAQIVSETLSVVIQEDSARIHARYWIDNGGDTLRGSYGAPIDFFATNWLDAPAWDVRTFSRAQFSIDGAKPVRMSAAPIYLAASGKPYAANNGDDEKRLRRWFTAPMLLLPGVHRLDLEVTTTGSLFDGEEKGEENLAEFSPRTILWDYRPARNWGTGIVHDFLLTVDASDLERKGIGFKARNPSLSREEGLLVYRATDLDLGKMDTASWSWFPNAYKKEGYYLSKAAWKHPAWRGSTDLPDYPLAALSDGDFSTAWVAPRKGAKAWLEVDVPDSVHLCYIQITPGFCKSPKTWQDNSRIEEFTINGLPTQTAQSAPEPDSIPRRMGDLALFRIPGAPHWEPQESNRGREYPKRLRLEFSKVKAGERFQDLPISEIILLKCPTYQ